MSDVTHILDRAQPGDEKAAAELLPLVYEELRRLAAHKMAQEAAGQTLQATALVHEAWLRLIGDGQPRWQGRGHFFAAAAEAMRRILVENARRKRRFRHGGGQQRVGLEQTELVAEAEEEKELQVHEALDDLAREDPIQAQVVKLRLFAGLKNGEVAEALGVTTKTVQRYWTHAKSWLYQRILNQR
ncbi:MAG TPA: ECF-type sigma factor [Candidatus Angelobacter sp.]